MTSNRSFLVISLGASEFPETNLDGNRAFASSARAIEAYFRNATHGPGPYEVVSLFDSPLPVAEQGICIGKELERRQPTDLVLYYVGHGGFLPSREYFLALRGTRRDHERATGLQSSYLADIVSGHFYGSVFVLLDCCFAGEAVRDFQGVIGDVVASNIFSSFRAVGTTLLVAAPKDEPALAPPGHTYTMFCTGLLAVLTEGITRRGPYLSLEQVGREVRRWLKNRYGADAATLPEVHSPRQTTHNLAEMSLFANPAYLPIGRKRKRWPRAAGKGSAKARRLTDQGGNDEGLRTSPRHQDSAGGGHTSPASATVLIVGASGRRLGCAIDGGTVLTAGHLGNGDSPIEVIISSETKRLARVIWADEHPALAVAVLRAESAAPTMRLGRLIGRTSVLPCGVVTVGQTSSGIRIIDGVVRRAPAPAEWYEVTVDRWPEGVLAIGAPVFCSDRLVGLIVGRPSGPDSPLHAVSAERIVRMAVVGGALPSDLVLDAVELIEVSVDGNVTPMLAERDPEVHQLRSWAASAGVRVRLLSGTGARSDAVAHAFADLQRRAGWACVWLTNRQIPQILARLVDAAAPLLVVIDQPGPEGAQVVELLKAVSEVAGGPAGGPIRILVCAESEPTWWDEIVNVGRLSERSLVVDTHTVGVHAHVGAQEREANPAGEEAEMPRWGE